MKNQFAIRTGSLVLTCHGDAEGVGHLLSTVTFNECCGGQCYFFGRQGVRGRQKINCLGLWRSKTNFLGVVGGRKAAR
jgi:hypothetical protein